MSEKNNIMNKILLTLGALFLWEIGHAQLDPASVVQLEAINTQLGELNAIMIDNKAENYAQKLLGKDNIEFVKNVEDYMWKADEFLKKGREIQMIYNKEEEILTKLKRIDRMASNYKIDGKTYGSISGSVRGILSQVGGLVDDAQSILGDENTRMSTEGRRDILKETISKLTIIEMRLDEIVFNNKKEKTARDILKKDKEYQDDVRKSMEVFKKYNKNK